jgi:hypothetical protein
MHLILSMGAELSSIHGAGWCYDGGNRGGRSGRGEGGEGGEEASLRQRLHAGGGPEIFMRSLQRQADGDESIANAIRKQWCAADQASPRLKLRNGQKSGQNCARIC